MHQLSVLFTMFSIFILSVLAAPLPSDQALDKRGNTGRGTWFYDYTNESACGTWNNSNDPIVAVSMQLSGNCNRGLWITANGQRVYARVGDACEGCGQYDLDMSEGLFKQFADLSVGQLEVTWEWS